MALVCERDPSQRRTCGATRDPLRLLIPPGLPTPGSASAPPCAALGSSPVPPSTPPGHPEGKQGEDGISQSRGSGFPATRQPLSVYGEKGEMEKAGRRRRVASAAPPLGRLRRRESGADEGGRGSLVRSARDDAPRAGAGRPGSISYCRRAPWPRRADHQLCTVPSGGGG